MDKTKLPDGQMEWTDRALAKSIRGFAQEIFDIAAKHVKPGKTGPWAAVSMAAGLIMHRADLLFGRTQQSNSLPTVTDEMVDRAMDAWNKADPARTPFTRELAGFRFRAALEAALGATVQAQDSAPDPKHAIYAAQFSNGLTGWACGAPGCGFKTIDQGDMLEHAGSFVVKNVSPSLGK